MKKDFVSVIIPLYNSKEYIIETIKSIKQQTYKKIEIIVVDDCSTDSSGAIIKNIYKDIKLIKLEKNCGPAIARNKGIEVAQGEYISFLDSDDLWESKKIEEQIKFMKENKCAFSYTSYYYLKNKNKKKVVKVQKDINYKQSLKNIRILTSTVMFDMKLIKKEQIYMINTKNEDVATWWKILKSGYVAKGLQKTLVYYRVNPQGLTNNKLKNATYRWYLYRKVEKLNIIVSTYYFLCYIYNGIIKRV